MEPGWPHKNVKIPLSLIDCILISGDEAAQRVRQEARLLAIHKDNFDKIRFLLTICITGEPLKDTE